YIDMLVANKENPSVTSEETPTTATQKLVGQQRWDEALAQLEGVLKQSPNDENALLWKARILSWRGKTTPSIKAYKELIRQHPDNVLYYREGARVMGWAGRDSASVALYRKACRRFPDDRALR